jgi:hypothetical protein
MDAAQLTRLLGAGLIRDEVGYPKRVPMIAVDLDMVPAQRINDLLDGVPAVVIGVSERVTENRPGCDVLLTNEVGASRPWVSCPAGYGSAVDHLLERVRHNPIASVVLVQLLRLSAGLTVPQALVAESLAYSALQSGPEHQRWLSSKQPGREHESSAPAVVATRLGDSLTITLNRPEIRNAFNAAMRDGLCAALNIALADDTVTDVCIRGAGSSFCSGGDLGEFGTAPDPATAHLTRVTRNPGMLIHDCADRCVVHVHGFSIGAGVELAAFAGQVTAAPDATFALPELHMGLVPGAGGTVSIARRVGRERTAYLGLSGLPIDATTAHDWGLVDNIKE